LAHINALGGMQEDRFSGNGLHADASGALSIEKLSALAEVHFIRT
jgi:hypothetical protein